MYAFLVIACLAHVVSGSWVRAVAKAPLSRSKVGARLHTWQQALQEDPKLFEGCSKVFVDVGSNRGTHVRKLFEPEKYPGCPYFSVFDEGFGTSRSGPSSETGICAFGFEANPRWAPRLQEIEKAYTANGWRVKWFAPTAVGSHEGNLTFWANDKVGSGDSDWGFSVAKLHPYSRKLNVPQLDLSGFMQELSKHSSPGYKLMKMDIESAEFMVLPKFLQKNLLCQSVLDKLTIEWHLGWVGKEAYPAAALTKQKVEDPAKCGTLPSTSVEPFDDESFLLDGMPLPGEKASISNTLYHYALVAGVPFRRFMEWYGVKYSHMPVTW